jgi:hypothetical protein
MSDAAAEEVIEEVWTPKAAAEASVLQQRQQFKSPKFAALAGGFSLAGAKSDDNLQPYFSWPLLLRSCRSLALCRYVTVPPNSEDVPVDWGQVRGICFRLLPVFNPLSGFGACCLPHCDVHSQPLLQVSRPSYAPSVYDPARSLPTLSLYLLSNPCWFIRAHLQLDCRVCLPLFSRQRPRKSNRRQKLPDDFAVCLHVARQQLCHEGRQQLKNIVASVRIAI